MDIDNQAELDWDEQAVLEIGEQIGGIIAHGGQLDVSDVENIVSSKAGDVNCYPSKTKGTCKNVAYFISLTNKRYTKGNGHLTFTKALEYLVKHMQGSCPVITKTAILICDSWNPAAIEFWLNNIREMKKDKVVKAYFYPGDGSKPIPMPI